MKSLQIMLSLLCFSFCMNAWADGKIPEPSDAMKKLVGEAVWDQLQKSGEIRGDDRDPTTKEDFKRLVQELEDHHQDLVLKIEDLNKVIQAEQADCKKDTGFGFDLDRIKNHN